MLPILTSLAASGLSLLTNAIISKGKEAIEKKLAIKLPTSLEEVTPELTAKLLEVQNAHSKFLSEQALEEKKIEAVAEKVAAKEVSNRWLADMSSDSFLSKNIRPAILIYLTAIFSAAAIFNLTIDPAYINLLGQLLTLIYGAYFVGRTVEKGVDMTTKRKAGN